MNYWNSSITTVPRRTGDQTESKTEETKQSRILGSNHLSNLGLYPHVCGAVLIVGQSPTSSLEYRQHRRNGVKLSLSGFVWQCGLPSKKGYSKWETMEQSIGIRGAPSIHGCFCFFIFFPGQPGHPIFGTCFSLIILGTRATNIWQASTYAGIDLPPWWVHLWRWHIQV